MKQAKKHDRNALGVALLNLVRHGQPRAPDVRTEAMRTISIPAAMIEDRPARPARFAADLERAHQGKMPHVPRRAGYFIGEKNYLRVRPEQVCPPFSAQTFDPPPSEGIEGALAGSETEADGPLARCLAIVAGLTAREAIGDIEGGSAILTLTDMVGVKGTTVRANVLAGEAIAFENSSTPSGMLR